MSLERLFYEWVLKRISFNDVQLRMQEMLEAGDYSDLLSKIAYEINEDDDIDAVLEELAKEQEIAFPSVDYALVSLAVSYAKDIVDGSVSPYVGAKHIVESVIYQCSGNVDEDINGYEALVSEYDDFTSVGQVEFYGQDKCKQELKRIESYILAASKAVVTKSR
mgnify:CR=1 FL=1